MSLACEICYELYSDHSTDRIPRLLPRCGHDFCTRCIMSLCSSGETPVCPKCRTHIFDPGERDAFSEGTKKRVANPDPLPVIRCLLQLEERLDFAGCQNSEAVMSALLLKAVDVIPTQTLQVLLEQRQTCDLLDRIPTDMLQQVLSLRGKNEVGMATTPSPSWSWVAKDAPVHPRKILSCSRSTPPCPQDCYLPRIHCPTCFRDVLSYDVPGHSSCSTAVSPTSARSFWAAPCDPSSIHSCLQQRQQSPSPSYHYHVAHCRPLFRIPRHNIFHPCEISSCGSSLRLLLYQIETFLVFLLNGFFAFLSFVPRTLARCGSVFRGIEREQLIQVVMIANAIPLLIGSFYVCFDPSIFITLRTHGSGSPT